MILNKSDISGEIVNSSDCEPPEDMDPLTEALEDDYLVQLLAGSLNPKAALEIHLDNKPKCMTVSYDNIDGNAKSNDFVLGDEKENSYHWCSSIIFEDQITAKEISDSKVPPSILEVPVQERICVTKPETEHLLCNYTQFVMHLMNVNWPNLFPTMKTTNCIPHEYSKALEEGVNCWVGPLVFEDESTISGISKVN